MPRYVRWLGYAGPSARKKPRHRVEPGTGLGPTLTHRKWGKTMIATRLYEEELEHQGKLEEQERREEAFRRFADPGDAPKVPAYRPLHTCDESHLFLWHSQKAEVAKATAYARLEEGDAAASSDAMAECARHRRRSLELHSAFVRWVAARGPGL